MNKNQEQFLNELDQLFLKYRIVQVKTGSDGRMYFYSNGSCLSFAEYKSASFIKVGTAQEAYNPLFGRIDNET